MSLSLRLLLVVFCWPALLLAQDPAAATATPQPAAPAAAATAPAANAPAPAPTASAPGRKLQVIAKPAPPFVITGEGQPTGLTIDLWRRIAQELGYEYEISVVPTVPQLIDGLTKRTAEVGLGALTINSERQTIMDFSQPFYESGLQILVPKQKRSSMFSALRSVAGDLIVVIALLLVALLAIAHLLWFVERKHNPECFPDTYPGGVWEAGWWSICTLVTGGCENISPRAITGRLVAIVWMLTGFGLVSFVTARMASIMTVNTLTSEVRSLADLRGANVGTLGGTSVERFLRGEPVKVATFNDIEQAAQALLTGDLKAVIYDAPILRYYLAQHPEINLQLVGSLFEKQSYGIGLQETSALRKDINRIILSLKERNFIEELDRRWFGDRKDEAEGAAEK